ncbi:MAG: CDP-alcohol phosphatidyltransferase family protein [Spirochaetales bacterium]|nr:CDP-alcohol phosphatidyltransferase family protein [Spirochaetales bacterium]
MSSSEITATGKSLRTFFMEIKQLYLQSLKPFYTEELVTTLFFRPFGFLLALVSKAFRLTPDILSILRGAISLVGGAFFCTGIKEFIFAGALLFLVSNIFDCADGQLARILKKNHTRLGIILDGISDGISIGVLYLGTAIALFLRYPETGLYWWGMTILAVITFLYHLYIHGFLKFDFFLYSARKYVNTRESASELIKKIKSSRKLTDKVALTLLLFVNGMMELLSNAVLLKSYKGYIDWYLIPNGIPAEKKELFRKNYKKYNGWILLLFNNLGICTNQLIIIICGLLNRLDIAIYIIVFGSNLYLMILVLIQRLSFQYQLKRIKTDICLNA